MTLQGFMAQAIAGAVKRWKDPVTGDSVGVRVVKENYEEARLEEIQKTYLCSRPKCAGSRRFCDVGSCSIEECERHRSEWIRRDRLGG